LDKVKLDKSCWLKIVKLLLVEASETKMRQISFSNTNIHSDAFQICLQMWKSKSQLPQCFPLRWTSRRNLVRVH